MTSQTTCAALVIGASFLSACGEGTQPLPQGASDSPTFKTAAGALATYRAAVARFEYSTINGTAEPGAFLRASLESGILTDELEQGMLGGSNAVYVASSEAKFFALDARQLSENVLTSQDYAYTSSYAYLQAVRAWSSQGIGALKAYAPDSPSDLRGHLYALSGYAELLLADVFCSGIPLTTFDYNGDYTYKTGSTTQQVYTHARALFDTAVSLSGDSLRIQNLARVGLARTLLAQGQFDSAAAVAHAVPDAFQYNFLVNWSGGISDRETILSRQSTSAIQVGYGVGASMSDAEGINGLSYRSSGDPRTRADITGLNRFGRPFYFPAKFDHSPADSGRSVTPMIVASGIEARLIEAEAALRAGRGEEAMARLSTLRRTAYPSDFTADIPSGLSQSKQVDTLFVERANWLYLTGHRLGDLRRLVRQYHRNASTVFPTGPYSAVFQEYGSSLNVPIPDGELNNPLFTGCIDRGA